MSAHGWHAYAPPEIRGEVIAALDSIATDLATRFLDETRIEAHKADWSEIALSSGAAAAALFFDYRARLTGESEDRIRRDLLIERTMSGLESVEMYPYFFTGLAGVGWVLSHCLGAEAAEPACAAIDEVLLEELRKPERDGDFELMRGLVGYGVYALERHDQRMRHELLDAIVHQLAATAVADDAGYAWLSPFSSMPSQVRVDHPENRFTTGVAHGQSAVIAFLARLHRSGLGTPSTAALLSGAVQWMLATPRGAQGLSRFPYSVDRRTRAHPDARIAWCNGDIGVIQALSAAKTVVDSRAIEEEINTALAITLARGERSSGVVDASVCHGSSGLAHMFACVSLHPGRADLERVAVHWLRDTIRRSDASRYPSIMYMDWNHSEKRLQETPVFGVLTGVAGIGMALLASLGDHAPDWDRIFLLDQGRHL